MFMHVINLISAECRSANATQSVWGANAHPHSSRLISCKAPSLISLSITAQSAKWSTVMYHSKLIAHYFLICNSKINDRSFEMTPQERKLFCLFERGLVESLLSMNVWCCFAWNTRLCAPSILDYHFSFVLHLPKMLFLTPTAPIFPLILRKYICIRSL